MNIDFLSVCVALVMGTALGLFYFGGLWWTLKGIHQRSRPFVFLGLSYLLRTGFCLVGFWLVLRQGILALIISLIAFALVRFFLTRKIGSVNPNPITHNIEEGSRDNVHQSR